MEKVQNPTVSVVITCYNQAHFIGEAIDSVIEQTYQDFEIVVIDDGSSDNPSAVTSVYSGIRYIRQENQGVSAARNRGVRETTGDYVVFLDADDRLLPEALKTNFDRLHRHRQDGFSTGHFKVISFDGLPLEFNHRPCVDDDYYPRLLRSNFIGIPATVMFRRSILAAAGGFDNAADHAGDYELYLRVARNFPVHCHHQVNAEWRQHQSNTSNDSLLMFRKARKVLRAQRRFVKGNRRNTEALKAGMQSLTTYYCEKLIEEARRHAREGDSSRKVLLKLLPVLTYCPRIFAENVYRKLRSELSLIKK